MKNLIFASCLSVLAFACANAQELSHITGDIGAGFTQAQNTAGSYLDTGWNIRGGVGANFSHYLGAKLNIMYNDFGINRTTLNAVGVPGGDVHLWTFTVDPVIHLGSHSHFDFYITGGGGIFHEVQQFTAPTVLFTNAFIPFFGFYPVAFGATQILSSYSLTRPGWDAGAGFTVGAFRGAKFFAEAKFQRMLVSRGPNFDTLPVSFGLRW